MEKNEDNRTSTLTKMKQFLINKSLTPLNRRSHLIAISTQDPKVIYLYSFTLECIGHLIQEREYSRGQIRILEPLSNGGLASATKNRILIWELAGSSKYLKQIISVSYYGPCIGSTHPSIQHLCQIKGLNILASAGTNNDITNNDITKNDIVLWDIEGTNTQNKGVLRGHIGKIMCLACRDPGHLISWDGAFIRIWGIYVDEEAEHSLNTVCLLCFKVSSYDGYTDSMVAISILNYPRIVLKFRTKLKIWDVEGFGTQDAD